jgi:D-alanyl-D-alanine carboxypeptidase
MRWGRSYAANHNRLLGKVDGVDGIKTGYTNASGYNLASSVSRNGVRLVAVVMGGQTAAARDAQVAQLIENAYQVLDTRKGHISVAQLTVNKVGVDAANNMMSSTLTRNDQSGYTVSLPSVAQAIAGAAAAAASVIAPNAAASTPSRGAPLASTITGRSELEAAPGLY